VPRREGIPFKLKSKVASASCGMKAADEEDAGHMGENDDVTKK
jgi:hypothetical protein